MKPNAPILKLTELVARFERCDRSLIGQRVNVTMLHHVRAPDDLRFRTLTDYFVKCERGDRWLYWHWQPEVTNARSDCGYAGTRITDNPEFKLEAIGGFQPIKP